MTTQGIKTMPTRCPTERSQGRVHRPDRHPAAERRRRPPSVSRPMASKSGSRRAVDRKGMTMGVGMR